MSIKRRDRAIALFLAGLFLVSSCMVTVAVIYTLLEDKKSDTPAEQEAQVDPEKQLKGKPLAGFTPIASIPELQTTDTEPGTGTEVKPGDTVTVDYTGAIASTGIVFESSKDSGQPIPLSLSQVIAGWSQGIPGMKEGGTRRLLIPSSLAYGPQGSGSIPPNSDLVFDVTVYKVGQ